MSKRTLLIIVAFIFIYPMYWKFSGVLVNGILDQYTIEQVLTMMIKLLIGLACIVFILFSLVIALRR